MTTGCLRLQTFLLAVFTVLGCDHAVPGDAADTLPSVGSLDAPRLPDHARLDPRVEALIATSLQEANDAKNDPQARLRLGKVYDANGFDRLASEAYRQTLHLNQRLPEAWYLLALLHANQGQTQESLSYLAQVKKLNPDYVPVYWRQGLIHLDAGDTDAAASVLSQAQGRHGESPEIRMVNARLALQTDQPQHAVTILEQLQSEGANHPYLNQLLGTAYQRTGQSQQAEKQLAKATGQKIGFNDPWQLEMLSYKRGFETQYTKALDLVAQGNTKESIEILKSLLQENEQPVEVANALAAAYANDDRVDKAIEVLRASARAHPDAGVTHINLSVMYNKKGRVEPALAHAEYGVKLTPHLPRSHLQMARLLIQQNQLPAAAAALDRAFELGADGTDDRIMYGQVLLQNQRFQDAYTQLNSALQLAPDSAIAWAGLALAEAHLGQKQKALGSLNKAKTISPNDPFVVQVQKILSRM